MGTTPPQNPVNFDQRPADGKKSRNKRDAGKNEEKGRSSEGNEKNNQDQPNKPKTNI